MVSCIARCIACYGARRSTAVLSARDARWRSLGPPIGNIWRALLDAEGLGDVVADVAPHVRDAVRISTQRADHLEVGRSRVGGTPDLALDMTWPRRNGKPMAFLAQFDLEDVARVLPDSLLPRTGQLWFFYDVEGRPSGDRPSDANGWAVLYAPTSVGLQRASAPADIHKKSTFPLCSVTLEVFEQIPDLENERWLDVRLGEERSESYMEIFAYLATGWQRDPHQLLGVANSIQGAMEEECQLLANGITWSERKKQAARVEELAAGNRDWRLLFQVVSDGNAGMMWGDAGSLYFFIREDDLRAASFDRVWRVFQCYQAVIRIA